jgi:Flp pilus assembly protein TadG
MRCTRVRSKSRRGAAVVEFAFVAPFLIFLVLGMLEFGRAIIVTETLNDAARRACRNATHGSTSNASITSEANDALVDDSLKPANITILVNGQSVDASTAVRGDQISVQVSIPASSVYWTPYLFLRGWTLQSEPVVMMRQQ